MQSFVLDCSKKDKHTVSGTLSMHTTRPADLLLGDCAMSTCLFVTQEFCKRTRLSSMFFYEILEDLLLKGLWGPFAGSWTWT